MSRQYIAAGGIVEEVLSENRSFKSVVHSGGLSNTGVDSSASKVEYLLAAQTLKHKNVLFSLISAAIVEINDGSDIDSLFRDTNRGVFLVMLYELLFSTHKKIHGGGKVKRLIMEKYAEVIRDLLLKDSTNYEAASLTEEANTVGVLYADVVRELSLPQFVRINEIKMSIKEGLEYIKEKFSSPDCEVSVTSDELVPSLVRIAPLATIDLTNSHPLAQRPSSRAKISGEDEMVKNGHLIIQDKASCFPSQVLFNCWLETQTPHNGSNSHVHFIDACAAPGNKTSHLASLLQASGRCESVRISAVEQDPQRAQLLQRRMQQAGTQHCVTLRLGDFLQMNPRDEAFSGASAILLDPSCSGSGLLQRAVDRQAEGQGLDQQQQQLQRVEKLRRFQVQALLKAMGFEQVSLVVYSTCSLHLQENEAVVAEALHWQRLGAGSGGGWQLVNPAGFEAWPRRGEALPLDAFRCVRYQQKKTKGSRKKKPAAEPPAAVLSLSDEERGHLLRCFPSLDETAGFFCAVLRRELPPTNAKKQQKPLEAKQEGGGRSEASEIVPEKRRKPVVKVVTTTKKVDKIKVKDVASNTNSEVISNRKKKRDQLKEEHGGPVSLFSKKRFQVQALRVGKRRRA